MRKQTTLAVVVLMVVLTATYAGARRQGPGPEGATGPKGGGFMQDLTDEQRTALREILEAHRAEMESLRTEMEAISAELTELVQAEAGETAIYAKIDEMGALNTEMMKKRMDMRLEIRAQLTDEQKKAFDEKPFMMGGGPGRPGGGRGAGGGPNGGPGGGPGGRTGPGGPPSE